MKLEPKYYVLNELLERRLFRIPDYQRTYSWGRKQREDLFEDIEDLRGKPIDRHHFMATVVCLSRNVREEVGADEYETVDIVDGQQRLTTLIILLKAISKELRSTHTDEKGLKERLTKLLVKGDERLILLQTNHDSRRIFADYLRDGKLPDQKVLLTQADKNLNQAFLDCEEFVKRWVAQNETLIVLLKLLGNRLGFIFYILDDEGSVYTVFEVLNSRGLEVDWLDKCKSMLMGVLFEKLDASVAREHQQEVHQTWSKIYRVLGSRSVPGHEILRFAATLIQKDEPSKPLAAEAAFGFFRDLCMAQPTKVVEVSTWLCDVAASLDELCSNPRLAAVTDIAHARLLAVSLMQTDALNSSSRQEALALWEKISFRIFGLYRRDSRTAVGEYVRAAHKIHAGRLKTKEGILQAMRQIGKAFPVEQAVLERKKDADWYNGWEPDLRYFLHRYEEYLCDLEGGGVAPELWEQIWRSSPNTTIEHIHPQTRNDAWRGKLGRGRYSLESNVNRLGNLLLLPPNVNSATGQKSFSEKKKIYKRNYLRMHDEVLKAADWTKKAIDERESRLLEWARNEWAD